MLILTIQNSTNDFVVACMVIEVILSCFGERGPQKHNGSRHVCLCAFVYVHVCVTLFRRFLDERQKLSTEDRYTSTMWYSLAANLTRFLIYRCIYSRVVCVNHSPQQLKLPATKLPTAYYFSISQMPALIPAQLVHLLNSCCNWHISVAYIACYATVLVYTNRFLAALLLVATCYSACLQQQTFTLWCSRTVAYKFASPHHLHSWQLTNL